ncbi:MAG: hypothetical protein PF568_04445, partial [Deltaproteobacteria bacterium]|nr:hypothetical protein [Deltaproteobacteria bacterium]
TELCRSVDGRQGRGKGTSEKLFTFVDDRLGHDFRYAIDAGKIKRELGWQPQHSFSTALAATVEWYLGHQPWVEGVKSGDYHSAPGHDFQLSDKDRLYPRLQDIPVDQLPQYEV